MSSKRILVATDDDDQTDQVFEVECVCGARMKSKDKLEVLVKWRGYGTADVSWTPEENLESDGAVDAACYYILNKHRSMIKPIIERTTGRIRKEIIMHLRLMEHYIVDIDEVLEQKRLGADEYDRKLLITYIEFIDNVSDNPEIYTLLSTDLNDENLAIVHKFHEQGTGWSAEHKNCKTLSRNVKRKTEPVIAYEHPPKGNVQGSPDVMYVYVDPNPNKSPESGLIVAVRNGESFAIIHEKYVSDELRRQAVNWCFYHRALMEQALGVLKEKSLIANMFLKLVCKSKTLKDKLTASEIDSLCRFPEEQITVKTSLKPFDEAFLKQ